MYYPDYYLLPVPILCIISYVLYMKNKLISPLLIAFVIALTSWIWISKETGDILKILSTIIASGLAINFTLHINTRQQTQAGDNNQQSGDNSKNVKQSEGTIQQAGDNNRVIFNISNVEGSVNIGNPSPPLPISLEDLNKVNSVQNPTNYKNEN